MNSKTAADFFSGVLFWVNGWRHLFRHRPLLMLALIPFIIAVFATGGLAWSLTRYLPHWIVSLTSWMGFSHGFLGGLFYYPLLVSAVLLAFFASIYVLYFFQALVAVPFYSLLADRTLEQLKKKPDDSRLWNEWASHTLKMIRVSLIKTVILLAAGFIFFVFSFMPVLNLFALIGALMILALDCMDYSLEALGYGFRKRVAYFWREKAQWLGMALGLGLTLLLPGLTLLVIPGAIAGAALIVKN